jgi:hypothetical protein
MMCPVFNAKTFVAKLTAVWQFMQANSLVYRMGTHKLQCRPEEVAKEVADFMLLMRPILKGPHRDRRYILNMDQTPVYFSMSKKRQSTWLVQKQSTFTPRPMTRSTQLLW